MNKFWEYETTEVARADRLEGFPDHLNKMGQQGWELEAVEPFNDLGGMYLTVTAGGSIAQNPFFYQSVVFLILAVAFYAMRSPQGEAVTG